MRSGLDKENGEAIGELGVGMIVPVEKWADTTFFELACDRAEESFIKAGALQPIEFREDDILVQEYPGQDAIAFLFHRRVLGKSRYHPCVIKLSPDVIAELVTAGRWQRPN